MRRRFDGPRLISRLALLIVLGAYALRVYHLGAQSLWFDEGWSWHLASLSLDDMARATAADRSPVLYYALLHAWTTLTGPSEFAMRYLSTGADVIAATLVMALGGALARPAGRLSLLAGLLYAVCPLAVWYAQETRMYALVAASCLGSTYWLWRWLRAPAASRPLVISAVLLALAVHSHYYAIFLLPAHGGAVLLEAIWPGGQWATARSSATRKPPRTDYAKWLLAASGVIAVLAPWLLMASAGFAYDDGFAFPLNTITGRLAEWAAAFAGGGLARPLPEGWDWMLVLVVLAGCASFLFAGRWRGLAFTLVLVAVPLLAATVAVRLVYPYRSVFHPRYLIYVAPVACVLLGGVAGPAGVRWVTGLSFVRGAFRRRFTVVLPLLAAAVIAVLWLPALNANYSDPGVARDDARAATRHVVEALRPGDVVVMTRDNYAVRYYLATAYPAQAGAFIAAPEGLHGILKNDGPFVRQLGELNPNRVRLVLWQDEVVDPQKLVESTLWAHGYEVGEIDFRQIRLPLYQLQSPPAHGLILQPLNVTFGDKLDLTAYWMRQQGIAGDWFYTVLAWKPRRKLDVNYKVFVQIWNDNNQVVFQRDKRSLNDLLPMSSWVPGDVLRDPYAMVIPLTLPAGEYRVAVGVYDPAAIPSRLAARADGYAVPGDAVILGTLQVQTR